MHHRLFGRAEGDAVLLIGSDGIIRGVTPAAERLLAAAGRRLVGGTLAECGFADLARRIEEHRRMLSRGADGGGALVAEQSIADAGGRRTRLRCTSTPLSDGREGGMVVVLSDMAAEERDERARRELEQQSWHVQRLDAIGRLAGGVAHEFNNVFGAIVGCASLLRGKAGANADFAESIAKIEACAMKASGLTGQLLAFARRTPLDRRLTDIHESITRVTKVLENVHGDALTIETDFAASTAVVDGDESRLEDALLKLGINARQVMPDGGTLVFRTRTERLGQGEERGSVPVDPSARRFVVAAGEYVVIRVCDNGPGIEPAVLPHIFEPFFTTHEMATAPGLGLASAYGTVKQHNGYIFAESRPGEGATFTIYLPVSVAGGAPRAEGGMERGTGTIVVAVADRLDRESVVVMLEQCGYETIPVSTGGRALECMALRPREVDLLLMDLVLPGESSAACLLQVLNQVPDTPVVVASSWRDIRMQSELERAGVRALVDKPFRAHQVSQVVADVLRQR